MALCASFRTKSTDFVCDVITRIPKQGTVVPIAGHGDDLTYGLPACPDGAPLRWRATPGYWTLNGSAGQ